MPLTRNDNGSDEPKASNSIYEIIMVAIAAAIILVWGTVFLLMVMKRRWNLCRISYDEYAEENGVSSVNIKRNIHDNISTIDIEGPLHITYVNERSRAASEIPIGKVKLSRDALLYISLITCMNLPDDIDSEENV